MSKFHLLPLALGVFAASLLFTPFTIAQDSDSESVAAAKALLETMDMEKVMAESLETGIGAQLEPMKQLGIPDEGMKELEAVMLDFLKEVMAWDTLEPDFIRLYTEAFTAEELRELNAFYQTPIGKKSVSVTPQLMAEGMMLGQQAVQTRMPELQARIRPVIEKHMKPAQ